MINILLALFLSSTATAQVLRQNGAGPLTGSALTPASVAATGAAGISLNVLGTSTVAVVGGGVGYIPYTLATTTTTTTAGGEVFFSTLTVPANSFNKAGQQLHVACNFGHAGNTNNVTPHLRVSATTELGSTSVCNVSNAPCHLDVWITWVSHALWIERNTLLYSTSVKDNASNQTGPPFGTVAMDETTALPFACSCTAATANGDCSFLDMRMEWLGM